LLNLQKFLFTQKTDNQRVKPFKQFEQN